MAKSQGQKSEKLQNERESTKKHSEKKRDFLKNGQ
jgi:hypothetical protein